MPAAQVAAQADQVQVVLGHHIEVLAVLAPGELGPRAALVLDPPEVLVGADGRPSATVLAGNRQWSSTSDSPQTIARASWDREVEAARTP
jgi:hypothetical protein